MHIPASALLLSAALAVTPGLRCDDGGGIGHGGGTGGSAGQPGSDGGAACTPLVVADPAVSLDGYKTYSPAQKQNNPAAGEPFYVYLAAGSEGVVIPGPEVPSGAAPFVLASPSIALVGQRETSADGYNVTVNPQFHYAVSISDFEYEVSLARVELCENGGVIRSQFVFLGNPGASGVAHDIAITAAAGSTMAGPTAPVTVEVR